MTKTRPRPSFDKPVNLATPTLWLAAMTGEPF
jgi:hypothetical protein